MGKTITNNMRENLEALDEAAVTIHTIMSDVLVGGRALSEAVRERGICYTRFRHFAVKILQIRDGGRTHDYSIPVYEPTAEEKIYATIFGLPIDEAYTIMPDDAEETVERILTERLDSRTYSILRLRLEGNTFKSIGERYGMTKQNVQQTISKAFRHLRRSSTELLRGDASVARENEAILQLRQTAEKAEAKAEAAREEAFKRAGDIRVSALCLSQRPENCLRRANIETVGEVAALGTHGLLHLRGMGKKSLLEIVDKLRYFGIDLEARERILKGGQKTVCPSV